MDPKAATIAYQKGQITLDRLSAICWPLIKRLCRAVARQLYAVEPDDLAQELWLVYERKITQTFDPEYPLEPLLLEYARRIGMSLRRENLSETTFSDLGESDSSDVLYGARLGVASIDEDAIDRKRALDLIDSLLYDSKPSHTDKRNGVAKDMKMETSTAGGAMRARRNQTNVLPALRSTTKIEPNALPEPPRRKRDKGVRLGPDHQELVRIRKTLGWTQCKMADELLIRQPRLASYEYGRTDSVPQQIMLRAYELEKQESAGASRNQDRFANRSMADILMGWCESCGVDYADNRAVSELVGASVPTIVRWKNAITRPSIQGLIDYDARVVRFAAERRRKK